MEEDMIVTALPTYPHKKIKQDLGFIVAYDDSIMLSKIYEQSIKETKKELIKKAKKLGANAILGLNVVPLDSSRATMSGEAVFLEDE